MPIPKEVIRINAFEGRKNPTLAEWRWMTSRSRFGTDSREVSWPRLLHSQTSSHDNGSAKPEEWPRLFEKHFNANDLDAVMALYEPEAGIRDSVWRFTVVGAQRDSQRPARHDRLEDAIAQPGY